MRIEHIGLQVFNPVVMADWYIEHLGFVWKRAGDPSVSVRFLADVCGRVMLEIYNNPRFSRRIIGRWIRCCCTWLLAATTSPPRWNG